LNKKKVHHDFRRTSLKLDLQFQTGLLWQDSQHKEWIWFLNELTKTQKSKQGQELFNQAVSFLVMYVHHHFGIEEEYMRRYAYPEEKFHGEEHRLYLLRLKDFRGKHREYSDEAVLKMVESMTEWLYSHIMENDKKLGKFILKKEHL